MPPDEPQAEEQPAKRAEGAASPSPPPGPSPQSSPSSWDRNGTACSHRGRRSAIANRKSIRDRRIAAAEKPQRSAFIFNFVYGKASRHSRKVPLVW